MDYLALYAVLLMMIVAILVNRVLRGRINEARKRNRDILRKIDDLIRHRSAAEGAAMTLRSEIGEQERRIAIAEDEVAKAGKALEERRAQPIRRYFVFDRLEPRAGGFWECDVVLQQPLQGASRAYIRSWMVGRCYIIVGKTESEVRARLESRFPVQLGFALRGVRRCKLADPDGDEGAVAVKPIVAAAPVESAPTGSAALWASLRGGS
ncbi:MAG: hypothetical protein P4M00_17575 [Azospirillaceae bacterium]|nr:hypothetical protein [Azospirillaceae bacterium]